jgi:hypothetical protein
MDRRRSRRSAVGTALLLVAVLMLALFPSVGVQAAPAERSEGFKRPQEVSLKISGWCDNTGSDINLLADAKLPGVDMVVTLSNNTKGTHLVDVDQVVTFAALNEETRKIATKPPAFGGAGGNPWLIVQVVDDVTKEIKLDEHGNLMQWVLGRCVTGAKNAINFEVNAKIGLQHWLDSYYRGVSCSKDRSELEVGYAIGHEGTEVQLLLVNQINKQPGQPGVHVADADIRFQESYGLTRNKPRGGKGWWDKEERVHGPGGNPRVYSRTPKDDMLPPWDPKTESTWGDYLGRCNKL